MSINERSYKFGILIRYIIFVFLVVSQVYSHNDIINRYLFNKAVYNEFELSNFFVDFYLESYNEKAINNNSKDRNKFEYKVSLKLDEINDVNIFPFWFSEIYLKKLGFYDKKLQFIEKHQLIGKMRFLQLRSTDNDTLNCSNNKNESDDKYYYKENFKINDTDIKFNCNENLDLLSLTDNEKYINFLNKENCKNGRTINDQNIFIDPCNKNNNGTYNPFICEIFNNGIKYRNLSKTFKYQNKTENLEEYFVYDSQYKINYYEKNANFFDIDYDYILNEENDELNKKRLDNFGKFLFHNWIDTNTRILVVSFLCYQTSSKDDSIFSVSLYLEFSKTRSIKKSFELLFYQKYIESYSFDKYYVKDLISYIYFIFLFLYSSINLFYIIKELKYFRKSKIDKKFITIINFLLNTFIFTVFCLKSLSLVYEYKIFKIYFDNGFKDYFPISYYISGFLFITYVLEQIMICLIVLNILNSFFFEFCARIFLTFKFAWKYLISYLIIYFIILIAYAATCNVLYGSLLIGNYINQ
jgi:hypothetical protein